MKCQHRKVRVRGKDGKFHAECQGCDLRGPDYDSPTEAFLACRSDFRDIEAERAAMKAKDAQRA